MRRYRGEVIETVSVEQMETEEWWPKSFICAMTVCVPPQVVAKYDLLSQLINVEMIRQMVPCEVMMAEDDVI